MGRKVIETEVAQFTEASTENAELMVIQQENNSIAAADAVIMGSFDVIKALGRIEAANLFTTVGDKLIAETALNIRDSKNYKGLPYQDETGNIRHVGDFGEFCKVFLGKSYTRTMELIGNYNQLGPDLYEQAEKLGFRQRDYNALKALPEDDKKIIAQAIESEDLDKALDFMQQMAAKHWREKESAAKQLNDLTESAKAKDQVISSKTTELNKKDEKLALLQNIKKNVTEEVDMPGEQRLMALQEYTRGLTAKIEASLRSEIVKLINEFDGDLPKHMQLAIAQSLGLIITAAYGVAGDLRIAPALDIETAANDPVKADVEEFEAWQALQAGE